FFDSEALGFFIEQRTSNNFVGGGPHLSLDVWRNLDAGFGLFARVDGAAVIGSIHQSFEEAFVLTDGSIGGGTTEVRRAQVLPVLFFEAGLSWSPHWYRHWSRYSLGYMFEQWWNAGEAAGSHGDI